MIRNLFHSPKERSIAIGIWTTCFTLGGVLGPLVGGLLLQHFWWGSVFLVGVPVMATLCSSVRSPARVPGNHGHAVDIPSVAMSMIALLAIAYGVKHLAESGVTATAVAPFVVGGPLAGRSSSGNAGWLHRWSISRPVQERAFTAALGANMMALFAWVWRIPAYREISSLSSACRP